MPAPKIAQLWKALSLNWHLGLKPEFIQNKEVPEKYAHISFYYHDSNRPHREMRQLYNGWMEEHYRNSDPKQVRVLRIAKEFGENILFGKATAALYPRVHTLLIDHYNCYFESGIQDGYALRNLKNIILYGDCNFVESIYSICRHFPQAHWIFVETGYEQHYDEGKFRDLLMLMPTNLKGICFYSSTGEREKWAERYNQPVRDLYPTPSDWIAYEIIDYHDILDKRWSYMVYERITPPWKRRHTLFNLRAI